MDGVEFVTVSYNDRHLQLNVNTFELTRGSPQLTFIIFPNFKTSGISKYGSWMSLEMKSSSVETLAWQKAQTQSSGNHDDQMRKTKPLVKVDGHYFFCCFSSKGVHSSLNFKFNCFFLWSHFTTQILKSSTRTAKYRGARLAQWWERSPSTNVSRVRFPDSAS